MDLDDVQKELLAECAHDHVGLWKVVKRVGGENYWMKPLPTSIRERTIKVISDLLQSGWIEVGTYVGDKERGWEWNPMQGPDSAILDFIETEWDKLGETPNLGDVCWFTATPAGKTLAYDLGLNGY
jgi:hypothetical protein